MDKKSSVTTPATIYQSSCDISKPSCEEEEKLLERVSQEVSMFPQTCLYWQVKTHHTQAKPIISTQSYPITQLCPTLHNPTSPIQSFPVISDPVKHCLSQLVSLISVVFLEY